MQQIMMRKTVNLSPEDQWVLSPFLEEGSAERDELSRMAAEGETPDSESAALIALARIDAPVVRERILERGYEELAVSEMDKGRPLAKRATNKGSKS